jgi:hypothetical protein
VVVVVVVAGAVIVVTILTIIWYSQVRNNWSDERMDSNLSDLYPTHKIFV